MKAAKLQPEDKAISSELERFKAARKTETEREKARYKRFFDKE